MFQIVSTNCFATHLFFLFIRMSTTMLCTGCESAGDCIEAESWCTVCGELVCTFCTRAHIRLAQHHRVVPKDQIRDVSYDILTISQDCSKHPHQKLVLFCCQYDTLVCPSCVSNHHRTCKHVMPLKKSC